MRVNKDLLPAMQRNSMIDPYYQQPQYIAPVSQEPFAHSLQKENGMLKNPLFEHFFKSLDTPPQTTMNNSYPNYGPNFSPSKPSLPEIAARLDNK